MRPVFFSLLVAHVASFALGASTVTEYICETGLPSFPSSYVQASPLPSSSPSLSAVIETSSVPSLPDSTSTDVPLFLSGGGKPVGTISTKIPQSTISTVYSTTTYTITSCAPSITDCPARLGSLTTDIISLYTTICPVTETEISPASSISSPGYSASSLASSISSSASVSTLSVYHANTSSVYSSSTSPPYSISNSSSLAGPTGTGFVTVTTRATSSPYSVSDSTSLISSTRSVTAAPSSTSSSFSSLNTCAIGTCGSEVFAVPTTQRVQDCSSYFRATLYPTDVIMTITAYKTVATVFQTDVTATLTTIIETQFPATLTDFSAAATETDTVTSVFTVSPEVTNIQLPPKRDLPIPAQVVVSPTSIPTYASDCNSGSYSSVCLCANIGYATVTASARTSILTTFVNATYTQTINVNTTKEITLTETATVVQPFTKTTELTLTVTTVLSIATPTPTFVLLTSAPGLAIADGFYFTDNVGRTGFVSKNEAVTFTITDTGALLVSYGVVAETNSEITTFTDVFFDGPDNIASSGFEEALFCSVDSGSGALSCLADGVLSVFYACGNSNLVIGILVPDGCTRVTFTAESV